MSINVRDLLDASKLGKKGLVVEAPEPYTKYENGEKTDEIAGYRYQVILSASTWDKISIKVEESSPSIKKEQFQNDNPIPVIMEDLSANAYVTRDRRVGLSFKANSIHPEK
ncbi:hypothetical protein E4665_17235 [Sporolactobacillus shoreae]|uniref:DUF961 domain-containing protein n=1 Tax=Sporolactobacillus shoreae TaxID=1465501 RepID=A0A4Z0GGY6_9BACL|nr:hypothetical protein [Sporolactobacillus shoreae]TGA95900.1 hypothetical protein E4665_17235 [Sporolactobacillus shoreae]